MSVNFMKKPQASLKLRDVCKVKYLISSHVAYSKPLKCALSTMMSIPNSDKCVVVAGCAEPYTKVEDDVVYYGVRENAYELTGLIHVAHNPQLYDGYEYVLLLHDTIECGPRTAELVGDHPAFDFDISCVCNPPRMNIALYKVSFLVQHQGVLAKYDGISKQDAIEMELFEHPLSLGKLTDKVTHFDNAKFSRSTQEKKYSNDHRWRGAISSIDVIKWYKKGPTEQTSEDFRHRP